VVLGIFVFTLRREGVGAARAVAFDTLVVSELLRAFAARSPTRLLAQVGVFTNARLVAVVVLSVLFQIGLHEIPALIRLFQLADLPLVDRVLPLLLGLIPVTALEIGKVVRRARR
jgi:Ca2+-transporting ATPase